MGGRASYRGLPWVTGFIVNAVRNRAAVGIDTVKGFEMCKHVTCAVYCISVVDSLVEVTSPA